MLICGLNSDLSVRRLKGAQRPICPEPERIAVLSAIRWIDYITVFDELDPIRLLEMVRPDVHTNGSDYGLDCIEAPTVRKHGGRIHVVERVDAPSTTALLERIRALE
ncbi:MAG: hypothetical protein HC888_08110 [Candidatus Competibacteraceae bacterium]|nr:hypothetical protein [Candidatus Competibacteraceae bacterium]